MDDEKLKIAHHKGYLRNHMRALMEDFRPWERKLLATKQEYQLFIGAKEKFEELNKRLIKMGDKECYLTPWEKKCRATKFFKCIACSTSNQRA